MTQPLRFTSEGQRGFTLVELVTVIVLIGILAAAAAGRMMDRDGFDSRSFTDQTAALIRFGQKMAIVQNRDVHVRINANGIALCYQAACGAGTRVIAPGSTNSGTPATSAVCADETWACEAPPQGVTVGTTAQFYFDALGKPFAASDLSPTSVSTFATLTVQVSDASRTHSITVEQETGYVH